MCTYTQKLWNQLQLQRWFGCIEDKRGIGICVSTSVHLESRTDKSTVIYAGLPCESVFAST